MAFLSTLSLRRATNVGANSAGFNVISIHALLAESDLPTGGQTFEINLFLSTLSLRRATQNYILGVSIVSISIHALLAESDAGCVNINPPSFIISIHALLAESDRRSRKQRRQNKLFLSTLSLRRATIMLYSCPGRIWYFYPRSPCGERLLT